MQREIPPQFFCPISLDVMKDPVICADGHTYDRQSILAVKSNKSPMTGLPMDKTIISNINIRQLIEEFKEPVLKEQELIKKEQDLIKREQDLIKRERELIEKEHNLIEKEKAFETSFSHDYIGKEIIIYGLKSINGQKYNNKHGIVIFKTSSLYGIKLIENLEDFNNKPILLKFSNFQFV